MKAFASRERWTRRRKPPDGGSKYYSAGLGGGCEVGSRRSDRFCTILTIPFLSDEGVLAGIAPFLAPTLTPSAPNSASPLYSSVIWLH